MYFIKKIFSGFQKHLSLAVKLILLLSVINALINHLWYLLSTYIFLLIMMFIPDITKKYDVKIPKGFEWALLVFVIINIFVGKIGGIIVPIIFGIAISFIGLLILAILYSSNQIKKNYLLILLFSFTFALAFGVILELAKYYLKIILNQEITSGVYTFAIRNLTFVLLGALLSAIIGFIYMKSKKGWLREIISSVIKMNPRLSKKDDKEILNVIKKGESEGLELKSSLRQNLYTKEFDKNIEYSALKTITAFLNSNGGILLIGVSDKGEILGIQNDGFENKDKFSLHLINLIKEKIGKKYLRLIEIEFLSVKGKTIVKVTCKKSDKEVFLKPSPQEEEFYIRAGNATTQLTGSELIDYVKKRFGKN